MPNATLSDSVKIPEEVISRQVGGETVVLNLSAGMYYGLDSVGSRIWGLLADHPSLRTVFEIMADEYDVSPNTLEQDISRLVEELRAKGLVELVGSEK